MPSHSTSCPFDSDSVSPQSQRQVVHGTAAGRVVFVLSKRILRPVARHDQPARDRAPAFAFGLTGFLALFFGDKASIQIDDPRNRLGSQEIKMPWLGVMVIGSPSSNLYRFLNELTRRYIG